MAAAEVKQINGAKPNGAAKEPATGRVFGGRWKLVEFARNTHRHLAEDGVTLEDLKRPSYWFAMAKDCKRDDFIEVRTDDRRKLWVFTVLDVGIGWCDVHLLHAYEIPAPSSIDPDRLEGFDFERDTNGYWYAVRKADGTQLGRGHNLPSLRDAKRFTEDHASNRK